MTFEKYAEDLSKALGMEIEATDGAFGVVVDGTTVLVHAAGEFVLMMAEIGAGGTQFIASGLYKAVLEANFLYKGTAGATFAVNPEDGSLWLQGYNWLERLDAESSVKALDKFADTVKTWKEFVADAMNRVHPVADEPDASNLSGFRV